jgi:DNA-binding response OmpR family regulator
MRILVIEDELKQLRMYDRILKAAGHDTALAATLDAARQLLANQTFDACLSDVAIGHLDSIDLVSELRGNGKYLDLHVVFVSANPRHEERCATLQMPFFAKPVPRDVLLYALENPPALV